MYKTKLHCCDDGLDDGAGDSPLIVDVVDSIPADILNVPSDSSPPDSSPYPQ